MTTAARSHESPTGCKGRIEERTEEQTMVQAPWASSVEPVTPKIEHLFGENQCRNDIQHKHRENEQGDRQVLAEYRP
jgi:hypothetical protein